MNLARRRCRRASRAHDHVAFIRHLPLPLMATQPKLQPALAKVLCQCMLPKQTNCLQASCKQPNKQPRRGTPSAQRHIYRALWSHWIPDQRLHSPQHPLGSAANPMHVATTMCHNCAAGKSRHISIATHPSTKAVAAQAPHARATPPQHHSNEALTTAATARKEESSWPSIHRARMLDG